MKKAIRVRFAPSPTGLMHIGGARTALFNYLFAKHNDGQFILRLEDTDRERFVAAGVDQIQHSLEWLGLVPDEGYWLGQHVGHHGPYIQSDRLEQYQHFARQLVDQGLAYYSQISPQEFNRQRQAAIDAKKPFVYRQAMEPDSSPAKSTGKLPIRLKIKPDSTVWSDQLRGDFTVNNDIVDDFVILKADGFPTYNFANVIDDHLMDISHVIRGDEFIASTPKHALLYDYFKWPRPRWLHLPVINGPDGKKLSKRNGDADVLDYREKGYLPAVVLNYLALLGWNDGSEQEIFSLQEMIEKFDSQRIQKSPAIFDRQRLDWMNGLYIREIIRETDYLNKVSDQLEKAGVDLKKFDKTYIKKAASLERERLKTFGEAAELLDFFFTPPKLTTDLIKLISAKDSPAEVVTWLESAAQKLADCQSEQTAIEQTLRSLADELNVKSGQLFYPIRVAITGKTAAPGIFETIAVIGTTETSRRLSQAAAKLQ